MLMVISLHPMVDNEIIQMRNGGRLGKNLLINVSINQSLIRLNLNGFKRKKI